MKIYRGINGEIHEFELTTEEVYRFRDEESEKLGDKILDFVYCNRYITTEQYLQLLNEDFLTALGHEYLHYCKSNMDKEKIDITKKMCERYLA